MDKQVADPWLFTAEDVLKDYQRLQTPGDLDPLMERIGDAKYVLLGEASHGTHEYYKWRTALTKRLIEEKGFSFVAVEGDWPDCYRINRFVKGYADGGLSAANVLKSFSRWPTWMWANWEIEALAEWLREFNENLSMEWRVGFYGLDVYSLWESLGEITTYLQQEDPEAAELVMSALQCFEPYGEEGQKYAKATLHMSASCAEEVVKLLKEVRRKAPYYDGDREAALNAEMNAQVIANAEEYYRSMVSFTDSSWNIRDRHMVSTLNGLMKFHGADAKAIVWEHNTHIGDARATDMKTEGLINVGQLVREKEKTEDVVIVGFGCHSGSVIAGKRWGAPMEKMRVPPAMEGSIGEILHRDSPENKLLILNNENLQKRFNKWLGHRAIGVVYRPEAERGNYVPTILPSRYDGFMFIDKTSALYPMHLEADGGQMPDTYPFGF